MPKYRLAVDIGGTFTDFCVYDPKLGEYRIGKSPTTPEDLSVGVLEGVGKLLADTDLEGLEFFVHGTTAGINAFLQRRGAKTALITTEGFRDVYSIARTERKRMYDLFYKKPAPLIPRKDTFTVPERTLYDGSIEKPVTLELVSPLLEQLKEGGYQSVAVALLHSYANPENELRLKEILAKHMPTVSVSLSHEIANEWKEYERTSTVAVNAYVAPTILQYLDRLENRMRVKGFSGNMYLMQSNGGIMSLTAARKTPLQTLFSGPVGGTAGGQALSQQKSEDGLLCVDMGGTSFDVSLVLEGRSKVRSETDLEGFPILMPIVDIFSIGAGGGSIAWIEAGGLRVGPKSAGAVPGPACYGKGGKEPTITDANLVLGRIDASNFLGGEMRLDSVSAEQAVGQLAGQLKMGLLPLAEGILDIANAKMANAIRQITVRKGIDPRGLTIVAFGGAGPMHAAFLADELEIAKVMIPKNPGTFSAWGMLKTDIRYDFSQTFLGEINEECMSELENRFSELEAEGNRVLGDEKMEKSRCILLRTADMRYAGQEYVLNVKLPAGPYDSSTKDTILSLFHKSHQNEYGHHSPGEYVELVALRVAAIGNMGHVERAYQGKPDQTRPEHTRRPVVFGGTAIKTDIYDRRKLSPGHEFGGPAIVEERSCTSVIPPNHHCVVDSFGNILITKGGEV